MDHPVNTLNIETMNVLDAQKLGVQRYRDGKTFAQRDVYPEGFVVEATKAGRSDLIKEVGYGWHVANLAEPVEINDQVYVSAENAAELERICEA